MRAVPRIQQIWDGEAAQCLAESPPRTRAERLKRWAAALERTREVMQLRELDDAPRGLRRALRKDGGAAGVAFRDPLLRRAGLAGDSLGDVMAFFELSENEAHRILCDCHGSTMPGPRAAATVRRIARQVGRARRSALRISAGVASALGALLAFRLIALSD